MKVAALTMVYRDHWFLSRWIEHYGRHFGRSNLFIVSHGNEKPIRKMAGDANVIGIVRETSGDFDVMRWGFLNDILRILLNSYDCVVIGDVDELIVPNPRFGADLVTELGRKADAPVSFVTGMELVEQKDDRPIGENEKLLVQRRSGIWNWLYTKAAIVYEPVRIGRGAHFAWHTSYYNAENLLLFHLKFANSALFADIIESRADIRKPGSDGKTRTPRGNGWTSVTLETVLNKHAKLPIIDFYDGLSEFRGGTRPADGVHRQTRPNRFFLDKRFILPGEFAELL